MLLHFGLHIEVFAIGLAIYIIIKSLIFIADWASIVDLAGGIFLILMASFGFNHIIFWVFVIWFLQKGFLSFIS